MITNFLYLAKILHTRIRRYGAVVNGIHSELNEENKIAKFHF